MYQVSQTIGSTCQNSRQLSLWPKSLARGRWCPEVVYIPPPGDEAEKPTRLKMEATGGEVRSDCLFFYPRSVSRDLGGFGLSAPKASWFWCARAKNPTSLPQNRHLGLLFLLLKRNLECKLAARYGFP